MSKELTKEAIDMAYEYQPGFASFRYYEDRTRYLETQGMATIELLTRKLAALVNNGTLYVYDGDIVQFGNKKGISSPGTYWQIRYSNDDMWYYPACIQSSEHPHWPGLFSPGKGVGFSINTGKPYSLKGIVRVVDITK